MNKCLRTAKAVHRHGENVKRIFGLTCDPFDLYSSLVSLERQANRVAVAACNGDIDQTTADARAARIMMRLDELIHWTASGITVSFNYDARGHQLKITDETMRLNHLNIHQDMGGFGILAPDF